MSFHFVALHSSRKEKLQIDDDQKSCHCVYYNNLVFFVTHYMHKKCLLLTMYAFLLLRILKLYTTR